MSEGYAKWRLNVRKFKKTAVKTYHKARVPGQVRLTHMAGGSCYRNRPLGVGTGKRRVMR